MSLPYQYKKAVAAIKPSLYSLPKGSVSMLLGQEELHLWLLIEVSVQLDLRKYFPMAEEQGCAEGKWLPKTSWKSVSQSVFCGISTCCVLNTVPPIDDHGNSNSHVKIFSPIKLLECLPKCSSLPKERHRWNTNERL
ncbi:calmodulin-binding transcription activator 1-like [Pseudorca crassidens]|uniref:calmodulin-binding transcription activator 1-like n=1 Tax=Pseudorca crassidens TaxID=82174 RepID=UPI00352FC32A